MSKRTTYLFFLLLIIIAIILFLLDIIIGSVTIPLPDSLNILTGKGVNESWHYIILYLRLPRAVNALVTGAGLAVAGLLMQTLFRNPLAGPYVLGISSGASLGVALSVMATSLLTGSSALSIGTIGNWGQIMAAVIGSVVVFMLIMLVSTKLTDSVSLLIVGIMFGSLTTAFVNVLQYFSEPELVQKFVIWTMGSLSSTGWDQLNVMVPFIILGLVFAVWLIKPLNALLLGENNARITGVNIRRVRIYIILLTSLIAGAITAFNGPIAFIGLAVPHLVRLAFGSANHRILVPGSIVMGGAILLVCDLLSQVPGQNIILPINAVTALFGAPVVLWIILGRKKLRKAF